MNPERKEILTLPCLPGRLTPAETAWRLGFEPDHIPILVNLGLLKPLGRPPASSVKYFASIEIEALRNDPKWLAKASDALRQKWVTIQVVHRELTPMNANRTRSTPLLSVRFASIRVHSRWT